MKNDTIFFSVSQNFTPINGNLTEPYSEMSYIDFEYEQLKSAQLQVRVITKLPTGFLALQVAGAIVYYSQGAFYNKGPSCYVVVNAPSCVTVNPLPPGYTTMPIGGAIPISYMTAFIIKKLKLVIWLSGCLSAVYCGCEINSCFRRRYLGGGKNIE